MTQKPGEKPHKADAAADSAAGGPGIESCHGYTFAPGHPEVSAHIEGVGRRLLVPYQQIPVKFRFQSHMLRFSDGHQLIDKGVAGSIQTVVGQKSVKIGFGGFRGGSLAGGGEKFLSGLPVEFLSQLTGGGFQEGIVVKEEIGTLQTHVIHPAETLDGLTDIGRKGGKQKLSEPVVGIACGHRDHLGVSVANLHSTPKSGN